MKLILDFNILFSILKPNSAASAIFSRPDIELVAPEEIADEFEKWTTECKKKSGLPEAAFNERVQFVSSQILLVGADAYSKYFGEAFSLISDEGDVPYMALGLATGLSIWSNDKGLAKQDKVKVYTTAELIEFLDKQ